MTTPEDRLRNAIKQIRIAREDLDLHPQWDGKLGEAEVDVRGVVHFLDEDLPGSIDEIPEEP